MTVPPWSPRIILTQVSKVTRFEVIDHRTGISPAGRVYAAREVVVELSHQDGGRTLKVFVSDAGST